MTASLDDWIPQAYAVRLYSFIPQHREMIVRGDQRMRMTRQFLRDESVFEIRMPSRG